MLIPFYLIDVDWAMIKIIAYLEIHTATFAQCFFIKQVELPHLGISIDSLFNQNGTAEK